MLSARVSQELWPGFPKEIVRPKLPVVLPVIRHTDCGRPCAAPDGEGALAALSEEHRIVLFLHDADGYTLQEIHELTGTPVGTLKSRLHRARLAMREILESNGTLSRADACNSTDPEPV